MSVNSIDTVVLLFPNEEWATTATDAMLNAVVAQLRPNISYALTLDENLRTLSTHNADQSGTIGGLLYVPDLDRNDPCYELSKDYVPTNVTRQANLPPTDFTLIALAPWINVECTRSYLDAADQDPMRAFIFYLPNNGSSQPPPASSPAWDLGSAGNWKSSHGYPVYAVPSNVGEELIHQSSLYSGNMTSVPYGHQISEGSDARDYVRMYTELHVSNDPAIPSLGILLVIILAVLFVIIATTSATMHIILRLRRKSLQRRVANGEVNLEALGIKRLTVPQEHINKLPLFTYNLEEESKLPQASSHSKNNSTSTTSSIEHDDASEGSKTNRGSKYQDPLSTVSIVDDTVSNPDSSLAHKYLPYSQPTCPICLEDFESGTTPIRELPCGHIFHPECIDPFLSTKSSLCPMCKQSLLPKGYSLAKITNSMVRRERNIRRLRSRVIIGDEEGFVESDNAINRMLRYRTNIRRALLHYSPGSSEPSGSSGSDESTTLPMELRRAVLMSSLAANTNVSVSDIAAPVNLDPGPTRQEITHQHVLELAARRSPDSELVDDHRSKWHKAMSQVFPGFG